MSKTTTISVRVPQDTRDWLERRTRKMGTAGSAAARILEESRRRETFPGVEFRDTPDGRIAFVSETRVPVHLFAQSIRECGGDFPKVADHYRWPLWKAESAHAYAEAYPEEIAEDDRTWEARADFESLKAVLPAMQKTVVEGQMKLLLDEHLSPKVVEMARGRAPGLDIESIHTWKEGRFLSQSDERILRAATEDGRVLVSYDVRTIPPVLVEFGVPGEEHAGVIFVSVKTIPQNDLPGIAQALCALIELKGAQDWRNRVEFLTRE